MLDVNNSARTRDRWMDADVCRLCVRKSERERRKERSEGSASIGWCTHRGNKLIREAGCLKFEREPKGSDGGTDLAVEKEREREPV